MAPKHHRIPACQFMAKYTGEEVFGLTSESQIQHEQRTSKKDQKGVLLPGKGFRLYWDCVSAVLVLFISITLPYRLAFITVMPYRLAFSTLI
jgi:hypothetical protein